MEEVLTDPEWRVQLHGMTDKQRIDYFERLFMKARLAQEEAKKRSEEVLAKQKQFVNADESWNALQRNEDMFTSVRRPVAANPNPQALDKEAVLLLSAGFHEPTPVIPGHLRQNIQRDSTYWESSLVDNFQESLWQDAPAEVPLHALRSREAQSAVSVVKLFSYFRKSRQLTTKMGQRRVRSFTHISGNMQCKKSSHASCPMPPASFRTSRRTAEQAKHPTCCWN